MRQWLNDSMAIPILAGLFIVTSLFLQPLSELIYGYTMILTSKSILLTDYVELAGLGPTLLNSGSLMYVTYILVRRLDLNVNGAFFAGILTIGGFAFFGKNLINLTIIFFGVFLYAKYKKLPLKSILIVFLFATGIGPISSLIMFGLSLPLQIGIPVGILSGVLSGFLLVELASHSLTFHKGYNLYNIGFSCGILSLTYYSLFSLLDVRYTSIKIISTDAHYPLLVIITLVCVFFFIIGLYLNRWSFSGLQDITKRSGRAVTDFTRNGNVSNTLINVGLTGFIALLLLIAIQVHISGPVIGGLLTIIGFGAFGKHVKNVLPPMIGVVIVLLIFNIELHVNSILAILFSTALAPLAGERGSLIGIVAGMIHLPITLSLGAIHGGILLYSNGFAAAFTAVFIDTIYLSFKRR